MADLGSIGVAGGSASSSPEVGALTAGQAFVQPARTIISIFTALAPVVAPAPGPAGERFNSPALATRFSSES